MKTMYPIVSPYTRAYYLAGQWVPVSSSAVAALRWQITGELDVKMVTGKTLHYVGADAALFDAFLAAPSKGTFLNARAKPALTYVGSS